ncbi:hypothetical protein D3C73_1002700 [compost metagenome]
MDAITLIVLLVIGMIALIRFRYSYRQSKMNMDKGEQIQKKLQELQKKRDED